MRLKLYFIGLDLHKKFIVFRIKTRKGKIVDEGRLWRYRRLLAPWPPR